MLPLAHAIFHGSPAGRIRLARERFFDQGLRPTGLTSETVIQSWDRCIRGHRDACEKVEFDPVTYSRMHYALQRNHELIAAWALALPTLEGALKSTTCSAILTDSSGVVIAAMPSGRSHERLMPIAHRVGVNLSEGAVGTTAPGVVLKTGRAASVLGAEHYFEDLQSMHCAASPIRDVTGRLIGVLDISSEVVPFAFNAASLVALIASTVESRLVITQSSGLLVLKLHIIPALLETPMAGLVAIDAAGRLAWANDAAAGLLGIVPQGDSDGKAHAAGLFGLSLGALASLSPEAPRLVVLPNGLSVWICAVCAAWDTERRFTPAEPPASETSELISSEVKPAETTIAGPASEAEDLASLRGHDRDFIAQVLHDCGGNVSQAAKRLHVSRNLIYRRLRL